MIKVKIKTWWTNDHDIRKIYNRMTQNGDYIWKDIYLTELDDYDFVVIQGSTEDAIDNNKCVVLQNEPFPYRLENYNKSFLQNDGFYKFVDIYHNMSLDNWALNSTYRQIEHSNLNKPNTFSGLISEKSDLDGQVDRLNFAKNYLSDFVLYQPCSTTIIDDDHVHIDRPEDAYIPYDYTFNAENTSEKNYFTEKIIRPILFECVTFYSGCPNVEKFLHPDCYVVLDLKKPSESLEIVTQCLLDKVHIRRKRVLSEQKRLLMNDNNTLNIIHNIIETGEIGWKTME